MYLRLTPNLLYFLPDLLATFMNSTQVLLLTPLLFQPLFLWLYNNGLNPPVFQGLFEELFRTIYPTIFFENKNKNTLTAHCWETGVLSTSSGPYSHLLPIEVSFWDLLHIENKTSCRNDIGHEFIDNNNMIYLPLYIVTRNVYSTTRELTSWAEINHLNLWRQVITME